MHDNKLMVGIFNLDAGVSIEEIIRGFTGLTQEEVRWFLWDEVYPVIDNEMVTELCNRQESDKQVWNLYSASGIIALSFPVIIVSNRTYVAPAGRESEFPRTRVATWRSLLQKTQFLTVRSILIERVNKNVAYEFHHAYEYRAARTKHWNQNE